MSRGVNPKNPKLAIWGASGHALVVADILRLCGTYEIIGLLDDGNPGLYGKCKYGYSVIGGRDKLEWLTSKDVSHLILAFGDCAGRAEVAKYLEDKGFSFASAIHPKAIVASDVEIGEGTVVAAGAIINPGARIGRHCIVNVGATVDHECVIGDAVHVGPGVHLGGLVEVGNTTWLGIGCTVRDRIRIGARSVIGAGAVIVKDVGDDVVAYGVPGRVIRSTRSSGGS